MSSELDREVLGELQLPTAVFISTKLNRVFSNLSRNYPNTTVFSLDMILAIIDYLTKKCITYVKRTKREHRLSQRSRSTPSQLCHSLKIMSLKGGLFLLREFDLGIWFFVCYLRVWRNLSIIRHPIRSMRYLILNPVDYSRHTPPRFARGCYQAEYKSRLSATPQPRRFFCIQLLSQINEFNVPKI